MLLLILISILSAYLRDICVIYLCIITTHIEVSSCRGFTTKGRVAPRLQVCARRTRDHDGFCPAADAIALSFNPNTFVFFLCICISIYIFNFMCITISIIIWIMINVGIHMTIYVFCRIQTHVLLLMNVSLHY